jgi:glutathione peroxidase
VFEKVDVNGPRAHPLFVFLKSERPGWLGLQAIRWNFTKFLVDRGKVAWSRAFLRRRRPPLLRRGIATLIDAPDA